MAQATPATTTATKGHAVRLATDEAISPTLVEPAATAMTKSTRMSEGSTSTPTSSSRTPPMAV